MKKGKGMKIAREIRAWVQPVANLLRATAELWKAISGS